MAFGVCLGASRFQILIENTDPGASGSSKHVDVLFGATDGAAKDTPGKVTLL